MSSDASHAVKGMTTPPINHKGDFKRSESSFRSKVTRDGSSGFPAESNRYHLYVSYACPWAHRTLIMRKLKGLEDVISFNVLDWLLGEGGWWFCDDKPGCSPDPIHNFQMLKQVYQLAKPDYDGRVTVPVLFDRKTNTIVNNESAEIIRMLNTEFNDFCKTPEQAALDFYPPPLREKIDATNEWVYATINNGVYKCGFATKQEPYEAAFNQLFNSLDRVEDILSHQRYLVSHDQITEADIRLFTTLVRFDPVYVTHFKCNLRRLIQYPNIYAYTRELYQMPGIKETVNMLHIKNHYFQSHRHINPHGIVPLGPFIDYEKEHGRNRVYVES